jgi:hypothetical protein
LTGAASGSFVFLSYARADGALARSLVDTLVSKGIRVWWDQSLEMHGLFRGDTKAALEEASAVIVLWTPASIGSGWVLSEALEGRDRGILVSLSHNAVPPLGFRQFQFIALQTDPGGREVEPEFASRFADLVRRGFLESAPRLANRRGFVVVDFAHAYRLRAAKAAFCALGLQILFYILSEAGTEFQSWVSADGKIHFPKLQASFLLFWGCLWVGRLLLPDSHRLNRSTSEKFFERRPVIVWLSCLAIMLVPVLAVAAYAAFTTGVAKDRLIATMLSLPYAASALFIIPALILRLLGNVGLIDRRETILRIERETAAEKNS